MVNYVLEILDGDRAGEVVPVAERPLRIGRKPGNDLVLADEKTSGVHAEVVLEGDRHVLRDLGSTNGTFLDGKRLTELVLTPGDVVTIGRLRVKFRLQGEATPDAGELAVRRLDAGRLRGRSGSVGLLAAVLLVGLGAGGWFWWQGQQGAGDDASGPALAQTPVVVPGNKLAAPIAGCENEEGWLLRAGGSGFASGNERHSGTGAFEARRAEGTDAADFAVLRTKDPLPVFAMRSMTLAAYVRTSGGGQVALRALLTAKDEQVPFSFCTGTALAGFDGWTRVETVVAVPPGCDRLQLEVVAIVPGSDDWVQVDDVAVTEAGAAVALDKKLPEGGPPFTGTAIGTGSAVALRSVDPDNPAVVLQVLPDVVPAPLQGLHKAELCVLSDLGAAVECTPGERGVAIECKGQATLQLVMPADATGGLLIAGADDSFLSIAAQGEFTAQSVLLGERFTRAWFRVDGEKAWKGKSGGGRYRLVVPASRVDVVLSFRAERPLASDQLRKAKGARDEGRLADALDLLRELATKMPMDTEVLGQANTLRADILAGQAATLAALQKDLEEASFFTTRGGFERVAFGADELVQHYGEHNLEDKKALEALRDAAKEKLAAIDGQSHGQQRTRLAMLAKVFADTQQTGLAQLVQRYIDKHLGN